MELTKLEFEEILDQKLEKALDKQSKELKAFTIEQIDSLAILVNKGFQDMQDQINELKPYRPWTSPNRR